MCKLSIENFIYINDFEISQYQILNALKSYKNDFENKNFLPGLIELSEISTSLKKISKKRTRLIDVFTDPIKKVDVEKRRLVFENYILNDDDIEEIFALIKWAIPHINDILSSGMSIKKQVSSVTVDNLIN